MSFSSCHVPCLEAQHSGTFWAKGVDWTMRHSPNPQRVILEKARTPDPRGGPRILAEQRAEPQEHSLGRLLLGPGTPAHSGIYSCYGSFNPSPYRWSESSDPLYLSGTGEHIPCLVTQTNL